MEAFVGGTVMTFLSSVLGGVFRLVPEWLKQLDKKNERAHELAMMDKQAEFEKVKGAQQVTLAEVQLSQVDVQAIIEATKAQATKSGVAWVDGLNSLVRPILAIQWLIILWPSILIATFVISVMDGAAVINVLRTIWGPAEMNLASSIASFWLVDRSLRLKK